MASNLVDSAVAELKETGTEPANGEDLGFSLISTALFDLTEQELQALYAMADDILTE